MDLDSMLEECSKDLKKEINLDQKCKDRNVMNEIKPWLAFSSNVPAATRDVWNQMVKIDALADAEAVQLQASNSYYSWEAVPFLPGPKKLLQELIRGAAQQSNFDESKTAKLIQMANPVIETEAAKQLQAAYKVQLVNDVSAIVKKDPNFSTERFPELAAAISSNWAVNDKSRVVQ